MSSTIWFCRMCEDIIVPTEWLRVCPHCGTGEYIGRDVEGVMAYKIMEAKAMAQGGISGVKDRIQHGGAAPASKGHAMKEWMAKNGRSYGALVNSSVELMGSKIDGEVEPISDPGYGRKPAELLRVGGDVVNRDGFKWEVQNDWPGRCECIALFDTMGKLIGKARLFPPVGAKAGDVVEVPSSSLKFYSTKK